MVCVLQFPRILIGTSITDEPDSLKMQGHPNGGQIIPPNSRRVAINLKLNSTSPQHAIALLPTDQPVRTNRRDVILMTKNYYLFENRWKWCDDVVDYKTVQYWNTEPFVDLDLHDLKRIKIYGLQYELPPKAQANLLRLLSSHTAVLLLEMDTLELLENSRIELNFNSLRLLSIDAIRIVTANGLEAIGGMAVVRLEAPKLNTVFLGELMLIEFCD